MTRKRKKPKKSDATKVILISYWPLLDYKKASNIGLMHPGQTMDLKGDGLTQLTSIIEEAEAIDSHAIACIWANWPDPHSPQSEQPRGEHWPAHLDDEVAPGTIYPVLVIDQAAAIANHLRDWCDPAHPESMGGTPTDWFDLIITDDHDQGGDHYCVVLMPRHTRSVDRWRLGYLLTHEEFSPADWNFEIVFRPLTFGAAQSRAYPHVRQRLPAPTAGTGCDRAGGRLPCGLLDASIFREYADKLPDLPHQAIDILGVFNRADPEPYRGWIDPYLQDLRPPESGPKSWVNPNLVP